jgi:hypothetical protein
MSDTRNAELTAQVESLTATNAALLAQLLWCERLRAEWEGSRRNIRESAAATALAQALRGTPNQAPK